MPGHNLLEDFLGGVLLLNHFDQLPVASHEKNAFAHFGTISK
jgi:hypothetical protein